MNTKVRKKNIQKRKISVFKQEKEILARIIHAIASGSSITDILVNSSELIIKEFRCTSYIAYVLEDNLLKCLIKRCSGEESLIAQEIILNIRDKQELIDIRQPVRNKDERFFLIARKLKLQNDIFYVVCPIINIGEFVGLVIIGREKEEYTDADVNLIFSISSLVASSFSKFRDISKKEDIKKQIEALMSISRTIVEKNNLEEILKIIVNIVAEVMEYKICSVMLYDEEKQELIIKATQSLSDEYKNKPNLKIGQSLSGRAIKERKPVSATDVLKDPNYKYPEIARKEGLKSMLAVPMLVKNRVIGVINVYRTAEHIFSQDEIKMLCSAANLAAVAIENAKLEEETKKAKDALETRKLIERAKGILMKLHNMTEEEAYTTMRKKAMDLCKPLKEVAEAIILTMDFNKKDSGGKDVSGK